MKTYFYFLLILLLNCAVVSAQKSSGDALTQMVETEKAFAAMAADKGTGPAFVEFAAPDGLVFTQKPTNAREFYKNRQPNGTLLAWKPNFYGISSTGEFGFTTGDWAFYPKGKTQAATAFGDFATIWRRQPDGIYRFAVDLGIGHAKYETEIAPQTPVSAGKAGKKSDSQNWQQLENGFADSLKQNGVAKTYEKFLAENSRLLRENHFPFVGRKEGLRAVAVEKTTITMKTLGGELSGDLAYAYGEYGLTDSASKTEKGFYLRVWKRESKGWRIALDVLHPVEPAGK